MMGPRRSSEHWVAAAAVWATPPSFAKGRPEAVAPRTGTDVSCGGVSPEFGALGSRDERVDDAFRHCEGGAGCYLSAYRHRGQPRWGPARVRSTGQTLGARGRRHLLSRKGGKMLPLRAWERRAAADVVRATPPSFAEGGQGDIADRIGTEVSRAGVRGAGQPRRTSGRRLILLRREGEMLSLRVGGQRAAAMAEGIWRREGHMGVREAAMATRWTYSRQPRWQPRRTYGRRLPLWRREAKTLPLCVWEQRSPAIGLAGVRRPGQPRKTSGRRPLLFRREGEMLSFRVGERRASVTGPRLRSDHCADVWNAWATPSAVANRRQDAHALRMGTRVSRDGAPSEVGAPDSLDGPMGDAPFYCEGEAK